MPIQWTQPSNAATFSYRVLEALEAPTTAEFSLRLLKEAGQA